MPATATLWALHRLTHQPPRFPGPLAAVVPPPQPTPPPSLTLAQAYGPTSATATASGAANITWVSWEFTATPASGAGVPQKADAPLVWWYGLKADTACECWLTFTGLLG